MVGCSFVPFMLTRIGDALLKEKRVTPDQLQQALSQQQAFAR